MGDMIDKVREVEERRSRLLKGGPEREIDRQHEQGKLTARERIKKLLDKATFQETDLWICSQKNRLPHRRERASRRWGCDRNRRNSRPSNLYICS